MSTKPTEATARLTATCHCTRIQMILPSRPTTLNECQCTICYKYGALWAYYSPDDITVTISDGATVDTYTRTDAGSYGDLSFERCGHCGCMMTWRGVGKMEGVKKMGVNMRMVPVGDVEGVGRRRGAGPRSEEKKGGEK